MPLIINTSLFLRRVGSDKDIRLFVGQIRRAEGISTVLKLVLVLNVDI
jgi:hypothetical protein